MRPGSRRCHAGAAQHRFTAVSPPTEDAGGCSRSRRVCRPGELQIPPVQTQPKLPTTRAGSSAGTPALGRKSIWPGKNEEFEQLKEHSWTTSPTHDALVSRTRRGHTLQGANHGCHQSQMCQQTVGLPEVLQSFSAQGDPGSKSLFFQAGLVNKRAIRFNI